MSVIASRDLSIFAACKEHGLKMSKFCMTCRLVVQPAINKSLSVTPCECGKDSEFYWQSPDNPKEFNATCESHTPKHLIPGDIDGN